jgi:hypothetical protein
MGSPGVWYRCKEDARTRAANDREAEFVFRGRVYDTATGNFVRSTGGHIASRFYRTAEPDPDFQEVEPPRMVTVRLSQEQAERLSYGLSDLLCWCRGYCAANRREGISDYDPIGISQCRDLNIALKGAIDDFEKGK